MTTEKLPRLLPIIIAALLLAGCATTWNEHQRATLTAASVQKPTVKRDAYHNPDATKSPGMANSIPNMTGGGLIPALIGSAIDAGVTASQQRHFEASAGRYFDQIKTITAAAPLDELKQEMELRLKADEFFSTRLTAQAANQFTVEVQRFGLVRAPDAQKEDMRLCYEIVCRVRLVLADGDTLIDQSIAGASRLGAHIEEFIDQPELLAEHKKVAISNAGNALQEIVDRKLGRTGGPVKGGRS